MKYLLVCLLILGSFGLPCFAHEVCMNTLDGSVFLFDIDPEENLQSAKESAQAAEEKHPTPFFEDLSHEEESLEWWNLIASTQGQFIGHPRDYHAELTPEEETDIRYIITFLAQKSLISIAFEKGDLEKAGDRIDHIHPLRFLLTIFLDEELKVRIQNIRGKGWVWNRFIGGLKECLFTEYGLGNLREAYVEEFAELLGLDCDALLPFFQEQKWRDLVNYLIAEVPREGDYDRYDC